MTDSKSGEVGAAAVPQQRPAPIRKHATTGKVIEPLAPSVIPSACRTGRISKNGCCATANGHWTRMPQERDALVMIRSR
jgi:hypothetical protein